MMSSGFKNAISRKYPTPTALINYFRHYAIGYFPKKVIFRSQLATYDTSTDGVLHYSESESSMISGEYNNELQSGKNIDIEQPFIAEVPNVEIRSPDGICITKGGEFILDCTASRLEALEKTIAEHPELLFDSYYNNQLSDSTKQVEVAFPMTDGFYRGYYHWAVESLPKLEALDKYLEYNYEKPAIILPRNHRSFVTHTLDYLGYSDLEYIEVPNAGLFVNKLLVPTARRTESKMHLYEYKRSSKNNLTCSRLGCKWLKQKAFDKLEENSISSPSRIYISRNDADSRRILNEEELIDMLSEFGFKRFNMSEISFNQEIEVFKNADVIVGPHGAGLSGMIFSENALVMEIFTNYINEGFQVLCSQVGHEYKRYEAQAVKSNIFVDIDKFREIINDHI